MTNQINETHLGTDATTEQAEMLCSILTNAGYPSEYTPEQGSTPKLDIPDDVWFAALSQI